MGNLTLVAYAPMKDGKSRAICKCDCGSEKETWMASLREGIKNGTNMTCGNTSKHSRPLTEACRRGHPWTEENTVYRKSGRYCKTCLKVGEDRRRERKALEPKKPPPPPRTHCAKGHPLTPDNVYKRTGYSGARNGGLRCKTCTDENNAQYQAEHREELLVYFSDHNLKRKYGMTREDKQRMLDAQGGKCLCCERTENGTKYPHDLNYWHVDHNHATEGPYAGEVRGILCQPCNQALGMMKEQPPRIQALERYCRVNCLHEEPIEERMIGVC